MKRKLVICKYKEKESVKFEIIEEILEKTDEEIERQYSEGGEYKVKVIGREGVEIIEEIIECVELEKELLVTQLVDELEFEKLEETDWYKGGELPF